MPSPVSEVTVRRQTGIQRKKQAKAARKRLRLRGSRRPKRLSARQKAAVRKRKGTGFYKKIAKLRASMDLPATIIGSISHRPEYIDAVLEAAAQFEKDDKKDAREFAKLFIEKDPAFSNTDTGMSAILFEAYLFEKGEDVVEQFLETQLEGPDTTFLAIFEGQIKDDILEKLSKGVHDICTFETLVNAGDTNHEDGTVSDVTILECKPKRQKKTKAAAQEPEPEMRTEGLLPETKADYEAILEEGGISDNAFMYLYPAVWEAATGTNGDIRTATEATGMKWYCHDGVWLPDLNSFVKEDPDEASWTNDTDTVFDAVTDAGMRDPGLAALAKIVTKAGTEANYKAFKAGVRKVKDAKARKALNILLKAIDANKYKPEFGAKFGGKPGGHTNISQVSTLFDLFSQSVHYNESIQEDIEQAKLKMFRKQGYKFAVMFKDWMSMPPAPAKTRVAAKKMQKEYKGSRIVDLSKIKEDIYEGFDALFGTPTRATRFAREIRTHARFIQPHGMAVYYEAREADHTEENSHQDAIDELCKKHGGKKAQAKRPKKVVKEEEDSHALVAGPFLGDGEPRPIHNGHCEVIGFPKPLRDGPLYLESEEGFQSKFLSWTVRREGTDDGKTLVHVGGQTYRLPITLSEVKGLLDKMEEFYADLPDEFDVMVEAYFQEYVEANGELLCHEDVVSMDLQEALQEWTSHEFIAERDSRVTVKNRLRRLACAVDLDTMSTLQEATKYVIRMEKGKKASVLSAIRKRDKTAKVDPEGNPQTAWVTTKLAVKDLRAMDGVKDAVETTSKTGFGEDTCTVEIRPTQVMREGDEVTRNFLFIDGRDTGEIDEAMTSTMVIGLRAAGFDGFKVGEKATTRTVKCPECDSKVLAATGYCVKCKKKTIKSEDLDEAKTYFVVKGIEKGGQKITPATTKADAFKTAKKQGAKVVLAVSAKDAAKRFKAGEYVMEDDPGDYVEVFGGGFTQEELNEIAEAARHGLTLEKIRLSGEYQAFKVLKGTSLVGFLMQTGRNTAEEENPWKAFRVARGGKVGEKIGFYYKKDGGKGAALQAIAKTGLESVEVETALICGLCGHTWTQPLVEGSDGVTCPKCHEDQHVEPIEEQVRVGDARIILPKGSKDYEGVTSVEVEVDNKIVATATRKKGSKKWTLKFKKKDVSSTDKKKAQAAIRDFHVKYVESEDESRRYLVLERDDGPWRFRMDTPSKSFAGLMQDAARKLAEGSGASSREVALRAVDVSEAGDHKAMLTELGFSEDGEIDELPGAPVEESIEEVQFRKGDYEYMTLRMAPLKGREHGGKFILVRRKGLSLAAPREVWTGSKWVSGKQKELEEKGKKYTAPRKAAADLKRVAEDEDTTGDLPEQMTATVPGVGKVKEPTHMKALARKAGKSSKVALELWGKAQAAANKQYPKLKAAKGKGGEDARRYYKVVTAIFKSMLGLGKEESEQSDPIIAEVLCHSCRSTTEVFLYPHNVGVCGECKSVHITPTGEVHYATTEEVAAADPALLEAVSIGTPPDMMLKWNVMEAVVWTDGRAEANKVKKALAKHFGYYKLQGMLGGLLKGGKVSESGFKAQVVVNPNVTPDRFLGGLKDAILKTGLEVKGHAFECKELGTVADLVEEIDVA